MALQALSGAPCFDAVLAVRPCARSPHFFVHHLPAPSPATPIAQAPEAELSTGKRAGQTSAVDQLVWRLGMIIPKRHAKRSVTRTLVKRQVRALWLARQPELPSGDWVVRLRAPLDRKVFTSAASEPLKDLLAQELRVVFADAARRATRAVKAAQAERTAPPMSALIDVGLVTPAAPPGEARS